MQTSLIDQIGNTPLVEIKRLSPHPGVRLFAKLEYMNPGGSIKDRAALFMIEDGERSGTLTPGKIVIEATSGNTGIGLALVCAVKGYRLLLAMSESASVERQMILRARGAEILLTPGHLGTDGAIEEVYRLARENPDQYFMTDQFNNPANYRAHRDGTAQEIWRQTGGDVTHVIATLGTTGTAMGLSMGLKPLNSAIQIIGIEPFMGHKLQGLKNMKESYCPEIFEKARLDRKINVDDEEAFEMTRRLAHTEGLLVGMSSGAAVVAALRAAAAIDRGTIVVILPDGGERYLSTPLFAVKEKADVHLFDTMQRRARPLETIQPGKVRMYSCGPTVDRRISLSKCRRYVFADLLGRYLEYRGYAIEHLVNITDLDDKTIQGSEAAGQDLKTFTQHYTDLFLQDMAFLGVRPAEHTPRASDHVDDMVQMARQLIRKGFAYEKLRSLYFDISRFADYGRLSGIDLDKIRLGHTVDLDEYEKENPRDFTLLKRARLSELKRGLFTKTEWGNVRPSWHIQCAAMVTQHFGETVDIHTGGRELVFPHHENEIAIAAALSGKPLANFWLHCEQVRPERHTAEKTNGELTLETLIQAGHEGREIRFWLLSTHYRKPIVFSDSRLANAVQTLKRLDTCIQRLLNIEDGSAYPELDQLLYDIRSGFAQAMDNDLNVSAALASLFAIVRRINGLIQNRQIDPDGAQQILAALRAIDAVLGVLDFTPRPLPDEAADLIEARRQARAAHDWATADRLRAKLEAMGVTIRDRKI
ncbi:MAG: cysteine--tRNA ligase [Desulfobacterales bacterium]|nr:cysteine--tRNA ligase [Desulfobacterales bacterium]